MRRQMIIVGLLAALAVGGCSGNPYSFVPASGSVTYEDGTPIPAPRVHLVFIPLDPPSSGDLKINPPRGNTDVENAKDGSFTAVSSRGAGDGLLPGKHKVLIMPQGERGRLLEGYVPPEYSDPDKTPVKVDTAEQPFKIKVKKPAGGVPSARG